MDYEALANLAVIYPPHTEDKNIGDEWYCDLDPLGNARPMINGARVSSIGIMADSEEEARQLLAEHLKGL